MFRCLAFFQALCECRLWATHIASGANVGDGHLLCNRIPSFLHMGSQLASTPTQVPIRFLHILSLPSPYWTSPHLHEGDVQWLLAESTINVYQEAWQKYQILSSHFSINPTPITNEKVALFVAFLHAWATSHSLPPQ